MKNNKLKYGCSFRFNEHCKNILNNRKQDGDKKPITIAVLGKGVVGKTSLIYRFIKVQLPDSHDPTIEDTFKEIENIDGKYTEIQILDTAGEEDYQNLIDQWIETADGIILVFALNDRESLLALDEKIKRIEKNKKNMPVVLIGNKRDLQDKRVIKEEEGKKKAKEIKGYYFETSALKDDEQVCKEPFIFCARKILEKKEKAGKKELKAMESGEGGGCKRCSVF